MNEILWLTGLIVWMGLALYAVYLLGWIAWCAVVAWDWIRWVIRSGHGKARWRLVPLAFIKRWAYFVLNGTTSTTWQNSGGAWDGFRKWTVYPALSRSHAEG